VNHNQKDQLILEQFVHIYCEGKHKPTDGQLCADCGDLLSYSLQRLERCPQDPKPACKHCEIHCYKPAYREQIRDVMRYSGKRLLLQGRFDLLWHYLF
jgi:predicted amidophosphoribosyltransferase